MFNNQSICVSLVIVNSAILNLVEQYAFLFEKRKTQYAFHLCCFSFAEKMPCFLIKASLTGAVLF